MTLKEYLLFFHNIPDIALKRDEAIKIAKDILMKEHNKTALAVLNNLTSPGLITDIKRT
jgi:hypothetical protein